MRRVHGQVTGCLCAATALVSVVAWAQDDPPPDEGAEVGEVASEGATPTRREGLEAFREVQRVLQSPRCRNCHPAGDRPLHGDEGLPHAMNVSRRSPDAGLPCTTCHRGDNQPREHAPPGVPNWHMPPADMPMVFEGLSTRALCEQLADPARNGGMSLEALVHHVEDDPLVLWGWDPGPGRSVPPISHEAFVEAVRAWVAAGAPCE